MKKVQIMQTMPKLNIGYFPYTVVEETKAQEKLDKLNKMFPNHHFIIKKM